jgi:hypothetical protein
MSKRPRIYELYHNTTCDLLYESTDREEALEHLRLEISLDPLVANEATFAIMDGNRKVLVEYTGRELVELVEDEFDG